MSRSVTSVQELGALTNNLTHSYSGLATESCRIALACPTPQVVIYWFYFILMTIAFHRYRYSPFYACCVFIDLTLLNYWMSQGGKRYIGSHWMVCSRLVIFSSPYHDTDSRCSAVGPSLWLARWFGIHCPMTSELSYLLTSQLFSQY